MGGGHAPNKIHDLLISGESSVHRLPPDVKLVALVVFASSIAMTPRHAVWAFAVYAAVLAAVTAIARVPIAVIGRRLLIVAPFLMAAALVPFIGDGPQTKVGPFNLSTDGLWAAWNICAKALLGATASILLTSTTPIPDLLVGMTRLRVPRPVVSIVAFMVRYLDLLADQFQRMRLAMAARGHDPRWLWQARPVASAAGTLFVHAYERGERTHQAMLARGFIGHMPDLDTPTRSSAAWLTALGPVALAVSVCIVAIVQ